MKSRILVIAIAAILFTLPARADLMGDSITANGLYLDPTTATVDAGVEFTGIMGYLNFDFGSNTLTITSPSTLASWSGFGSYVFSGFTDTINSVTLVSNTGFTGTIIDNLSFGPNSITFDMSLGNVDYFVVSTAIFEINSSPSSVPDTSATFTLLCGALAGLAVFYRRFER